MNLHLQQAVFCLVSPPSGIGNPSCFCLFCLYLFGFLHPKDLEIILPSNLFTMSVPDDDNSRNASYELH
jgi:hypothetical protein